MHPCQVWKPTQRTIVRVASVASSSRTELLLQLLLLVLVSRSLRRSLRSPCAGAQVRTPCQTEHSEIYKLGSDTLRLGPAPATP